MHPPRSDDPPFRRLGANRAGRDFVVGDLHGQLMMLERLLAHVDFDLSRDRLFSLGDLIDRGPHNEELIDLFDRTPAFHCLRGNHEALMLASAGNPVYRQIWMRNGGLWAENLPGKRLRELITMVERMPFVMEIELPDGRSIGLVHAEVPPGKSWKAVTRVDPGPADHIDDRDSNLESSLLWGRRRVRALETMALDPEATLLGSREVARLARSARPVEGIDTVYVGHSIMPARRPLRIANIVMIDTGAYLDTGRLTLAEPASGLYWQCDRGEEIVADRGEALPPALEIPPRFR